MNHSQRLPFQPSIQGLRAISIVLVVLCHAGVPWFQGGFIGVDLFFVISGYLITGLLLREQRASGHIAYAQFISRRLKRLLPSLITMVLVTTVVASLLLSPYEAHEQMGSLIYALTWTSNLFFAFSEADYFADLVSKDLFLHTWSLGVEEQFYLFWPLLLSFLGLVGFTARKSLLLGFLGLAFTLSLAACWYWSTQNSLYAFYLMPTRIWQFSLGAMVYVVFSEQQRMPANLLVQTSGLLLIVISAVSFHAGLAYPGLWALIPSTGAALLLATSNQPGGLSLMSHPIAQWLGDRSYAWYLWHWPFLIIGLSLWGDGDDALLTLLLVVFSLVVSSVTYQIIELPFWRGKLSHARPKLAILVSLLAMVSAGSVSLLQLNKSSIPVNEQLQQVIAKARGDVPEIYYANCDTWYHSAEVNACIGGNPNAPKTMIFIGDSIGAQWYSAFAQIFSGEQWRIEIHTKSACPMVDEPYFYPRIGSIYTVCEEWRNTILKSLPDKKVDTIIIGSSETYDFSKEQWIEGSTRILKRLSPQSDRVLVIPGAPGLSQNGPGCIERNYRKDPDNLQSIASLCSKALEGSLATKVSEYLKSATAQFPNSYLLDLNDLVCPDNRCSALSNDGAIVYRDGHHLTDSFVRSQTAAIRDRINNL
jgi:peptidoglycan/LPS O-acetylase OafA/YrhL